MNPVFTQFNATTWGFAIGPSHCYAWKNPSTSWAIEIAAYDATGLKQVQAQTAGETLEGDFRSADGEFTSIFSPAISIPGGVDYQIAATPTGGAAVVQKGTF